MQIFFYKHLPEKYEQDVLDILTESDQEFVPPLSNRISTTQASMNYAPNTDGIQTYFNELKRQWWLVAVEGRELLGFMSLVPNHGIVDVKESKKRNVYLTTIIVAKRWRHANVANELYQALIRRYADRNIITRTWSTNDSHLHILRKFGFYRVHLMKNHRGPGIDTVYYCKEPTRKSIIGIMKAYGLWGNVLFVSVLGVMTVVSLLVWRYAQDETLRELMLAIFTSLIASILCASCELMLKYANCKSDDFVFNLKSYGIENLLFHKETILEDIIPRCRQDLWMTGYRLIMTSKGPFLTAISRACDMNRGLNIRLLLAPMWSDMFQLVYPNDDVSENYVRVLATLCNCVREYSANVEIRLANKLIFNDTYKVDSRIITSPYLNSSNENTVTAKDFFSLDITDPNKQLYTLMNDDYLSVWNSSTEALSIEKLKECFFSEEESQKIERMRKEEICELLKSCVVPVTATN